jgi:iron-sulfur cluster assembly protein
MFTLTNAAAVQIARAAEEQPDSPPLRVAAKIDDDGELVYGMGFDSKRDDDLVVRSEGVAVLIAPPSQPLLDEAQLDFVEVHPGEFQFIFTHAAPPTSQPGCGSGGCGSGGCGSRGTGGSCT